MNRMMEQFLRDLPAAGAVAWVEGRTGELRHAVQGFADLATGRLMALDSMFWVASMTKPITATATMIALDDGLVDLDEPVTTYLPDFTPGILTLDSAHSRVEVTAPRRPITVRDLLSHRSGLPFVSPIDHPTFDLSPIAVNVAACALAPLAAEPGERFIYSNAGFNVVARVLEAVSGLSFEDYLQTRLLDPLGMTDTTFWPSEEQVARLALTYRGSPDGLETIPVEQVRYPLTDRTNRFPFAGGGLFSTTADMARFGRLSLAEGAVEGTQIVSPASIREMLTNQQPDGDRYGLGWSIDSDDSVIHGGAYGTELRVDRVRGFVSVWMVQVAGRRFPVMPDRAIAVLGALA